MGFLSFLQLIGTAKNMLQHSRQPPPQAHFNAFLGEDGQTSTKLQHTDGWKT